MHSSLEVHPCYASSSLGPVHFGLGAEGEANLVEIKWPSGIVQILKNIDADRVIEVTEPTIAGGAPE